MTFFSLFTGIGGFERGIQQAYESILNRHETSEKQQVTNSDIRGGNVHTWSELLQRTPSCVGYSEIDKYAIQIYQKHFPDHKNYGDIKTIIESELPDFDLLVGGFPCQSFSIAGKRGGFEDVRGTLFFDICRIIKQKQPRLLLLENVKGLLSHDEGRTFTTIIATLDELGYDLQWQVLNSKDFGVPQNRERVIIVGHLRGTPRPEVFPFTSDDIEDLRLQGHVCNTLTARYEGAPANGTYVIESELNAQGIIQLNHPIHSNDRVYSPRGIGPTLNTMQGGNRQPFIAVEGPSGSKTDPSAPSDSDRVRETPRLPRSMDGISDSQRYKCCGNAVTTNVIQAVMERLLI